MNEIKIVHGTIDELRIAIKQDMIQTWEELEQKKKEETPEHPYTKREVKHIFGVTYQTLDRWDKNGTLPNFKIGSRVYYHREVVDKYLKQRNSKGDETK